MSYDCTWCKRRFHSVHAQWQHKYDKNHFDYECNCCDETYEIEKECVDHEIEDHYYCSECNRTFRNRSNIQQHLRSAAHIGSSITCPFCKRGFTTAASFVHHIENNGCSEAKSLDRDAIYQIVRQKDPSGVISKQVIVQTGSDFLQATDKAWNPDKGVYECDLCDRTFRQLQSLNHHLQSVTHQPKLYHCPKCHKEFVTFSGIIKHFESESCGYTCFSAVQTGIRGLTDDSPLLAFR